MKERVAPRRVPAGGQGRRTRPVRRASRRITPLRVAAAFVTILAVVGIYGATSSAAFGYTKLRVDGARFTTMMDNTTNDAR